MKIDGNSVTHIKQANAAKKPEKVDSITTADKEATEVKQSKAENFALNTSGIEQQRRKTNDNITQLQNRQQEIKNTSQDLDAYKRAVELAGEKQESLKEAQAKLAETLKNPPFANNNTVEKLEQILGKEQPSAQEFSELKEHMGNEQKLVEAEIHQEASQLRDEHKIEKDFVNELQQQITKNPQLLSNAYGNVDGNLAHGLLGSETG